MIPDSKFDEQVLPGEPDPDDRTMGNTMKPDRSSPGERQVDWDEIGTANRYRKMPISNVRPWHRQNRETVQAYSAFQTYLTLPTEDRSIGAAATIAGKSYNLFRNWSSQWSWVMRVAAYEEHFLLLRLDSLNADKDQMWRQQQELGTKAVSVVEGLMEGVISEFQGEDGTIDLKSMRPADMIRLLTEATKLQRAATLGRAKSAELIAQENESLVERHADEMVAMFQSLLNSLSLSDEQQDQAQSVIVDLLESGATAKET